MMPLSVVATKKNDYTNSIFHYCDIAVENYFTCLLLKTNCKKRM